VCRDPGYRVDYMDSRLAEEAGLAATVGGVVVNTVGPSEFVLGVETVPIALTEGGLQGVVALIPSLVSCMM